MFRGRQEANLNHRVDLEYFALHFASHLLDLHVTKFRPLRRTCSLQLRPHLIEELTPGKTSFALLNPFYR